LSNTPLRISDFANKVGKLVDRRGALSKHLSASGHPTQVVAALVCRLPSGQIAAQLDDLRAHNVILIGGEGLLNAFDNVRFSKDPDKTIEAALADLQNLLPTRIV
jgi:hypothetical protein